MTTTIFLSGLMMAMFSGKPSAQTENFPETTVSITVHAGVREAFDHIVPIPLPRIFKAYKKYPAIVRTDETEKWIRPGLSRTVYFEDGTTAHETLVTVVPDSSFSYRIEGFTSVLRRFAQRVEGRWTFKTLPDGRTSINWTYRVIPKNFMARAGIELFLMKDIRGILEQAMKVIREDLDGHTTNFNQ